MLNLHHGHTKIITFDQIGAIDSCTKLVHDFDSCSTLKELEKFFRCNTRTVFWPFDIGGQDSFGVVGETISAGQDTVARRFSAFSNVRNGQREKPP